ncbi:hypothetical protein EJP67_10765 [Variovorax guangxiensis]|uniref:ATP-binding protein n=1 Tax=Variovorax guangxiensis TaxID=1775474 RepID=A0A433MI37_9BURK|nr:protein DpdH [Variovorax guangxiensis]RUR67536.1 hypothetical protein EJP67_10765 [Variovorax guangxiensis]
MSATLAARHPGLDEYWPDADEVRECIGTEAEGLPDAVLLAVHQPTRLLKRPFGGTAAGTECIEDALLDFVLHGLKPEGYLLAPVTGPSGAGKSHIVRWLEIRLKHHPRAQQFDVIRVPKSASLRTVIEAVLQPVAHLPEYAALLEEVAQAASALAPTHASALFGTMLQLGLQEKAEQWSRDPDARIEGFGGATLSGHARQLASFLQDPVIAPHFLEGVYPRLLQRALRGRDHEAEDADQPPQFEPNDLVLPPNLDEKLPDASRGAQAYYRTRVERNDGRNIAVAALNAVLDSAVAGVFKLGQLTHGKTLQDIMREIREALHGAGRELVLLVEDFYALTGIQEHLLAMCIQGVNDGPRPMCPMRTVLAMTDGTLVGRDTIATRSEFEWMVITESADEAQVVDAVVELAGRYLNAARIGRGRLIESYEPVAGTVQTQFEPRNDDDDGSEWRRAFGFTKRDVPLFPLSRDAIYFLARKHLVDSGRMRFNPRRALQRIVRDILLARSSFENGTFPRGLAIEDALSVDLANVLQRVPNADDLKDRYRKLIVCWGNTPTGMVQLQRMPEGIYKAFGLTPLAVGTVPHAPVKPSPPETQSRSTTAPPPVEPAPIEDPTAGITAQWRPLLDAWVGGQRLDLQRANELRKLVRDQVAAYVDWNVLSLDAKDIDSQSFQLPAALGQKRQDRPENPVVSVTGPSGAADLPDAQLAREILALLRFSHMNGSLDYESGDEDAVHVAEFLERNGRLIERAALHAAELKLAVLAQAALRSAALRLGLPSSASLQDKLQKVLDIADEAPESSGSPRWDELRLECWSQREALLHALLRFTRVIQGSASMSSTPYAIDAARFQRAIGGPAQDAATIGTVIKNDAQILDPLRALLPKLTNARLTPAVQEARKVTADWIKIVLSDTGLNGTSAEAEEFCRAAQDLMNQALPLLWPPDAPGRAQPLLGHAAMTEATQRMQSVVWKEVTGPCRALAELDSADSTRAVELLAKVSWPDLKASRYFVQEYTAFTQGLERALRAEEAVHGNSDAAQAITAVVAQLESLVTFTSDLAKENK